MSLLGTYQEPSRSVLGAYYELASIGYGILVPIKLDCWETALVTFSVAQAGC